MLCRVLCVLLFLALTAERNGDPLLYNGEWRSPMEFFAPLFDSLPIIRQPAWNVLVVLLAPLAFLLPGAVRRRAWPMDAAILASLATLALGVVWGVARGGDAYWAYYQLTALVWAMLLGLLLLSVVRSKSDVQALGITVLAAAVLRALLGLYYFFKFVRGQAVYPPHVTSHEDSTLFAAGVIVALSWAIARWRWQTWILATTLILPLLLAMKVNNRRVAWFELIVALGFLYLLLRGRMRRRVNRWGMVLAPLLIIYVVVGWGRPGAVFTPLRAIDSTTGENQDASALARNEENLNLVLTYIQHPVAGSGWGHRFISVSSYYAYFGGGFDEMYRYTPHNALAALTAFGGLVGLFGVLGVVPITAFLGARGHWAARRRIDRAATMAAVCFLPAYGIQAFADLGLQHMPAAVLLSMAMAVSGRVSVWTGAWPGRARPRRRRRRTGAPQGPIEARPPPVPA